MNQLILPTLGMIFIVLAWLVQIVSLKKSKKKKDISKYFLILQAVGILFLVLADFMSWIGLLNLISLIFAVIAFFIIKKR